MGLNHKTLFHNATLLTLEASFPFVYIAIFAYNNQDKTWNVLTSTFYNFIDKTNIDGEVLNFPKDSWLYYGIQKSLSNAKISKTNFIALGSGPGSATSLRIVDLTGEVLAKLWGVKIVTVPTFSFYKEVFQCEENIPLLIRLNKTSYYNCNKERISKKSLEDIIQTTPSVFYYIWDETWKEPKIDWPTSQFKKLSIHNQKIDNLNASMKRILSKIITD